MSDHFQTEISTKAADIFQEIIDRVGQIHLQFGPKFEPVRILLGPTYYLVVTQFARDNQFQNHVCLDKKSRPEHLMGFPMGLKRSEGIEFEFSYDCALYFVKGLVNKT